MIKAGLHKAVICNFTHAHRSPTSPRLRSIESERRNYHPAGFEADAVVLFFSSGTRPSFAAESKHSAAVTSLVLQMPVSSVLCLVTTFVFRSVQGHSRSGE